MRIDILQEDIDHGICEDGHRCAVARAICRATGWESRDVLVEVDGVYPPGRGTPSIRLPARVEQFIERFDKTLGRSAERAKLKPFSFELKITEEHGCTTTKPA